MLTKSGDYAIESERDWGMYCHTPRDRGILSCITTVKDKEWRDADKVHFTFYVEVREYLLPNGRVQPRVYGGERPPPPRPYHEYLEEWDDLIG